MRRDCVARVDPVGRPTGCVGQPVRDESMNDGRVRFGHLEQYQSGFVTERFPVNCGVGHRLEVVRTAHKRRRAVSDFPKRIGSDRPISTARTTFFRVCAHFPKFRKVTFVVK
ncbi:hypothetical protein D8S78_17135 [Natrialba swarupiae]|nr:hypothetical protein [Natrialba swarupiae]